MKTATTKPAYTNRLEHATSPYLLQHAHNPVDWYEWGPEALDKAKREDKPIFLSIGYSACHWCHVMAHESFENAEIAALMNRYFVNIKVDREERPDLDEIYMRATLILSRGQGGWPMSVWLTPERKPFFAGTYFPPASRWGRPGFADICGRIGELWGSNREGLRADGERLATLVAESLSGSPGDAAFTLETIDQTVGALLGACDTARGGLISGGSNKFPPSMALDLFLRAAARNGRDTPQSRRLLDMVHLTLEGMARGGIYDHLGGGIARYSTDPKWHVPHFEKMLYDQALVSRVYVDAWQFSKKPLYRRIASEIFDYCLADLQSPGGGFYSTRDADSEGEEGKYYVWTREEILRVLGDADGELFCSFYDVSDSGNWSDPHAPGQPKNILHVTRDLEAVARLNGVTTEHLQERLAAGRAKLLEVRSRRVPPGLDDKVLAEWNGLMIASLARGGAVFGERRYVDAAVRAAEFILENQYKDGRLARAWRSGRKLDTAFLTDYAAMIDGLIELYEATFDKRWLERASELNRAVIEHFYDEARGGFCFTADDHEQLIARSKDVRDGATPSGNSVQLMNLLRLSVMLGNEELRKMAERTMNCLATDVLQAPGGSERFLAAVEFALVGPVELAVIGDAAQSETQALLRQIRSTYLPNHVLMLSDPGESGSSVKTPLLADRTLVGGKPAVYVCRDYACQMPATTPIELARQLGND